MAKRSARKQPPWERENPKQKSGRASKKMSGTQKSAAKTRARKAGRPYPNLVDNMAAAKKGGAVKKAKKASKAKKAKKAKKAVKAKTARQGRTAKKAGTR